MKTAKMLFLSGFMLFVSAFSQESSVDSLPALKSLKIRKIPEGAKDYSRYC